jgi:hypothetical protein
LPPWSDTQFNSDTQFKIVFLQKFQLFHHMSVRHDRNRMVPCPTRRRPGAAARIFGQPFLMARFCKSAREPVHTVAMMRAANRTAGLGAVQHHGAAPQ